MVAEAGFRYPVAMTATVFCSYVSPLEGDDEKLAPCQDIKGRLWDVLWMLKGELSEQHIRERLIVVATSNFCQHAR